MKHEDLHNTLGWNYVYSILERQYRKSSHSNEWTKMWDTHKKEAEKTLWFTNDYQLKDKLESRRGELLMVASEILNGEK